MQSLDYRGLGRWNFIPLLVCLVLGSTVAAFAMGMVAISVLTFGVGAIATAGMIATAAMILGPVLGCLGGAWGALRSKSKALNAMRAQQLPTTHPLTELTKQLAAKIHLPAPEVYFYDDPSVNAFATGAFAENSAVVLSRGLLEKVSREELVAVIGHELGHIASGDIWKMNFAISFQHSVVCLFRLFGLGGFAKWAFAFFGEAAVMALSRRREYWADAVGTVLGGPEAMASALSTVHEAPSGTGRRSKQLHRSMLHWRGGGFLMSSHPTLGQRLSAINGGNFAERVFEKMGGSARLAQESVSQAAAPIGPRPMRNSPGDMSDNGVRARVGHSRQSTPAVGLASALLVVMITYAAYQVGTAQSPRDPVLVTGPTVVPRVAGWEANVSPEQVSSDSQSPPTNVAETSGLLGPEFEHLGSGLGCIEMVAKGEVREDMAGQGPGRSTLTVIKQPLNVDGADLLLSLLGTSISQCWKTYGGQQVESSRTKRDAKRMQFDVWIFPGGDGPDSECGVLNVPRKLDARYGGTAAYCR